METNPRKGKSIIYLAPPPLTVPPPLPSNRHSTGDEAKRILNSTLHRKRSGIQNAFKKNTFNIGTKVAARVLGLCMVILISKAPCIAGTYGTTSINQSTGGVYDNHATGHIDFSGTNTFTGDLTIAAGTEVVITGTVYMSTHTTIHIAPTATLEIDGGTITGTGTYGTDLSQHNQWWMGIEVAGDNSRPQPKIADVKSMSYSQSGSASDYNQGAVYIHDGATISWSIFGVFAGGNTGSYSGGGVIICDGSSFTNNYNHAIEFMPYGYRHPNYSYVNNCTFSYDGSFDASSLSGSGGHDVTPRKFISAWNNIFVAPNPQTSTFSLNTFTVTGFSYSGSDSQNFGDAFTGIYAMSCGYRAFDNYFSDLNAGIWDDDFNGSLTMRILSYNRGSGCLYGIYDGGGNLLSCNHNSFQLIGDEGSGVANDAAGIYLKSSTAFSMQENFLQASSAFSVPGGVIGIYAKNSGNYGNIINDNDFHSIPRGFSGEGNNHGLLLTCNDLSDVYLDYGISVTPGGLSSGMAGIAPRQGYPSSPAGNTFSNYCAIAAQDFYQDAAVTNVDYYYKNSNPLENPDCKSGSVTKHGITPGRTCGTIGPPIISSIEPVLSSIISDIAGLPVPPSGTDDQQAEYAEKSLEKQYYIGAMIQAYLQVDTISSNPDTLQNQKNIQRAINFVRTMNDPCVPYHLINLYIAKRDYDSAGNWLDTLSTDYGGSEVSNLVSYYGLLINGLENNFADPWSSTYLTTLEALAASPGLAEGKAQSLMQYLYAINIETDVTDTIKNDSMLYPPTFETIDGGGAPEQTGIGASKTKTGDMGINAYPDPVTDRLQVEINNETGNGSVLHIMVADNMGKVILQQNTEAGGGARVLRELNMKGLAKGIYFLTVSDNRNILHKQVIVKQ